MLRHVEQMKVTSPMTVGQLVAEMRKCGVLGAGRLAKAVSIMSEMFKNEYKVFLSVAGPMIPGGLRSIVGKLVERKYVDGILATGANIVHDIVESLGYKAMKGFFWANDVNLRKKGIGRVGDIYFAQEGFEALEREMHRIFDSLSRKYLKRISICKLLYEIGKNLKDEGSFLKKASEHNIPVFSPGLLDSMIGLHLWTYNQLKKFEINPIEDLNQFSCMIMDVEKVGAIILGGGLPKHFVLGANILREGVDAAIQVTLDRPEGGSLSGAPLEEAISWKKVKTNEKIVTVIGDATILFPIMVSAVLEELEKNV